MLLSLDGAFVSIGIWICVGIYNVAAVAFKIFLILANGNLVSADSYSSLISNLYLIIGVIMLFALAFALLRGMVNPEDQKQGTQTVKKIILNLVSSGIIMALLPTIFAFAYDFQDSVILSNTIGGLFNYGSDTATTTVPNNVEVGSNRIVNGVFTAFLNVNEGNCESSIDECKKEISAGGVTFEDAMKQAEEKGTFSVYTKFNEEVADDKLDFNFLLSLLAGLMLIYVGVSFCFDMALRMVKLVFYQIIAPIPLFLRIIPNSKLSDVFSKWVKVTLTCYLEVYIRIFVFYFCVYLCNQIVGAGLFESISTSYGVFASLLAKAFVLMGIVMFMRQAPKLFQEITGLNSGNMKLGIKDKLKDSGVFAAGAVLGSGGTALLRNLTNAGANFKNKWKEDKEKNIPKPKRVLNSAGRILTGAGSVIAGGISGAVRGGRAGFTAKNATEMRSAIKKGAQDTVDARVQRANYRAAHSAGGPWYDDVIRVGVGHLNDKKAAIYSYAGVKNAEQLKRENYAFDLIKNSRDKFDNDTDSLIDKEISKGNTVIKYGLGKNDYVDIGAIEAAKRELDNAIAQGHATKEMEERYNLLKRNARYKLQNATLISNEHWDELAKSKDGRDIQAKLSELRVDGVNFKGEVRNHAALEPLASSGIVGADFADNEDYVLSKIKTKELFREVEVPIYEQRQVDVFEDRQVDVFENREVDVYEDRQVKYYEDSKMLDSHGKPLKIEKTRTEKVKVGTKTEPVKVGTKTEKVKVGTKTEQVQVDVRKENRKVGEYQFYDDNEIIDKMNKNMKNKKGENSIAIAQQEQQKYEEKKK